MFTVFDFFKLMGSIAGAVFGGRYGYQAFGLPAAIAGVLLGYLAGAIVGNLPFMASFLWMRCDLKLCSTPKLKQRLQDQYFIAHLLIDELVLRGEPLEQFKSYVAELLHSDNADKQYFGKGLAQIWFPDLLADSLPTPLPSQSVVDNE